MTWKTAAAFCSSSAVLLDSRRAGGEGPERKNYIGSSSLYINIYLFMLTLQSFVKYVIHGIFYYIYEIRMV